MKVVLLLLLLLPLLSLANFRAGLQEKPEWKYVATSEDNNDTWKTYYDAANIERQPKGTARVWLKQTPVTKTDAEKQRIISAIIENRKLNNMSTNGYNKFAYSLTLIEFDCSGKQGRSIAIKDYDDADKLLGSDTKEGVPFARVREGSMSELILNAVCK